ncbi:unnamed protein product [Symbiodinium sp. CCMP2592]|nr:unnamed protein product [Symbiodinium sp. CCMP2592]
MKVVALGHVKDWQQWIDSLRVHWHGALLDTSDGVHSFTFLRSKPGSLPPASLSPDVPNDARIQSEGPMARTVPKSDFDVICYVKRYASDESVSQKPLLVLPHDFLARLPSLIPALERPLAPLGLKKRRQWLALAQELFQRKRNSDRTVRYLLKAAQGGTIASEDAVLLPWHTSNHELRLVRLENASPNTFFKLFPVARFRATLKRIRGPGAVCMDSEEERLLGEEGDVPSDSEEEFLQKAQDAWGAEWVLTRLALNLSWFLTTTFSGVGCLELACKSARYLQLVETVARAAILRAHLDDVIIFENTPFFDVAILKVYDLSQASSSHMRTELDASAAGSPMVDVSRLPTSKACTLAGNGMHVAQAGCILMVAALFLERV